MSPYDKINIPFKSALSQKQSCGGDITSQSGAINYPDARHMLFYDINEDCWWTIIADDNNRIEIAITYMDLQEDDGCTADYLEVLS